MTEPSNTPITNPFQDINASNMSDSQIVKYWTSPTGFLDNEKIGEIEFVGMTPNIIFGGRGSGKTTILRFLSFDVQRMSYDIMKGEEHDISKFLETSKFLGVYYRFQAPVLTSMAGKGISVEQWKSIFLQFFELVLGQQYLKIIDSLIKANVISDFDEKQLCKSISLEIFNNDNEFDTISDIAIKLKKIQYDIEKWKDEITYKKIDFVTTTIPKTKILYSMPKIFEEHIPQLKDKFIFYLLDEYENLNESQQTIINTLIKQPEFPATFKIGSRVNGLKTYQTLSGEYLREGSDYRAIPFEKLLLEDKTMYRTMLKKIAQSRINNVWPNTENNFSIESFLGKTPSYEEEARTTLQRVSDKKKHLRALHKIIKKQNLDLEFDQVVEKIACPDNPLVEKLNLLLLKRGRYPPDEIKTMMNDFINKKKTPSAKTYRTLYNKNKVGLLFQLISTYAPLPKQYCGFEMFANLSSGIIRTFLELCYYAFDEAIFHEPESLEKGKPISSNLQTKAVKIKSENFLRDIQSIPDEVGPILFDFIDNLGSIFRTLHMDERLSEPEPSYFITDYYALSEKSKKFVDSAVVWSALQTKNSMDPRFSTDLREQDFALNRILCARYAISHRLRGRTVISSKIIDTLITGSNEEKQTIRKKVNKGGPETLSQKTLTEFLD